MRLYLHSPHSEFLQNRNLYDIPDSRKVHKRAIPRLGGVSFLPSMLAATIVALFVWSYAYNGKKIQISPWTIFFAVGLAVIYTTGLIDDIFGVKAKRSSSYKFLFRAYFLYHGFSLITCMVLWEYTSFRSGLVCHLQCSY